MLAFAVAVGVSVETVEVEESFEATAGAGVCGREVE